MNLIFTNDAEIAPSDPLKNATSSRNLPALCAQFFEPLLKKALKILKSPPIFEKIPETEVELVLLDDPAMQAINKQTRGLDKPTDVLSFASREMASLVPTTDYGLPAVAGLPPARRGGTTNFPRSLGQIFISLPAARRNADEMRQPLGEELHFLFIHGLLHILGYDHQTPADETEMMTIAYQILGRPPYRPTFSQA